ncbi:hypothetical protein ADIAG_02448 [Paeniglutamicibacter gangotriensis Lz1y]|uniref:Uncharacterized protein n=1 Tax=Paeniglutamicibacter gangotriensis Lz1y TaxID=1276920 RepID=M7NIQ3_9MICC|nr:hypothetical protein ADIAG_02448 [Paeniglutamicibacter gangotriensis Lz1y]
MPADRDWACSEQRRNKHQAVSKPTAIIPRHRQRFGAVPVPDQEMQNSLPSGSASVYQAKGPWDSSCRNVAPRSNN